MNEVQTLTEEQISEMTQNMLTMADNPSYGDTYKKMIEEATERNLLLASVLAWHHGLGFNTNVTENASIEGALRGRYWSHGFFSSEDGLLDYFGEKYRELYLYGIDLGELSYISIDIKGYMNECIEEGEHAVFHLPDGTYLEYRTPESY